ncbi:MAG: hypothetical protein GY796_09520 [Chloroflexi bacterium]|nr:hypothetical protein [Chloroflexota bacterium]
MEIPHFQLISVDVSTGNFLVRGEIEPRGDLIVFLNDRNRSSFPILNVQIIPNGPEYKVPTIKQTSFTVSQEHIAFLAMTSEADAQKVQFVQSYRPVVLYTNWFAIRGQLHVHGEARDDELMDPTKDFFAVTNVSVFPIRQTTHQPQRTYPLAAVYRAGVIGYHFNEKE